MTFLLGRSAILVMLMVVPGRAEEARPIAVETTGQDASISAEGSDTWSVVCGPSVDGRCVVRQFLVRQSDSRQVLMAGLLPGLDGKTASLRLVLPFGLDPTASVTVDLDGAPLARPFLRTCLPGGCETIASIDEQGLARLKAARRLEIGLAIAGGGNLALSVDLNGFSIAFDRAVDGRGERTRAP